MKLDSALLVLTGLQSPPTWRCGLKHLNDLKSCKFYVTSHVEVWIETAAALALLSEHESPPTWRCGLKLKYPVAVIVFYVTSHVEVWIETNAGLVCSNSNNGHLPRGGVD